MPVRKMNSKAKKKTSDQELGTAVTELIKNSKLLA